LDSRGIADLSDAERIREINGRIREMGELYLKWARNAKLGYQVLSILTLAFSAAVPTVVLVASLVHSDAQSPWVASVAGIFGACATLTKSIDLLLKNHETWLRNNDSYGRLRSEQFLFEERAGNYNATPAIPLGQRVSMYADRIEAVIGSQANSWIGAEKSSQGVSE
jgi:hypothetical protein